MPFFGTIGTAPFASAASNWICVPSPAMASTQTTNGWLGNYADTTAAMTFFHTVHTTNTATYIDGTCVGYSEIVVDEEDLVNHAEYFELARQRGVAFRIRTAEEKRLAEEAAARARVEAERRAREREAAKQRSRELLLAHLTAEQREAFEKNKWFIVVGGKSGRQYRIRTGVGLNGNIDIMQRGAVEARLCCHCRHDIPEYDQYLAQKIALMWDEDDFLKTANRHAA